ncbi:MAG: hypothetical protein RLZZ367_1168 [Bacteroidota bacterium]|jgi:uncharacterized delta-60 repeat protein
MRRILTLAILLIVVCNTNAQSFTQYWASTHVGYGDNSDKFNAMVRDASGNLYAAGFTMRQGDGKDFLLVKFNSSGDTLWTRTYDGTGNGNDEINDLTFDNAGNIVVAGTSKTATGKDITTASYSTTGTLIWLMAYDHSGHLDDYGVKVVADNSGNIFTGGYGINSALNSDYVVVKYSSAGVQLATAVYDGADNLDDELADMAIDGSGNVIVTGKTKTANNKDDYGTIKYNNGLTQQWVKTLDQAGKNDRATGIWLDASGNAYVTGRSSNGGDYDFVTIKYNSSNGANGWNQPKLYDSNGDDVPADIAGNANEVVVSGTKFNGLQNDIQTIAYNPSTGAVLWSKAYTNVAGKDEAVSHVAIGPSDAVIVTGTTDISTGATSNDDVLILKYDGAGTQQYAKILGGDANANDDGMVSVADASGNIYTAGGLVNNVSMKDAAMIVHDAAGTQQYIKTYNGEGEFTDKVTAICNSGSDVYTTGYVYDYNEDRNFCTIKYDMNGNKAWVKTFNGPDSDTDEPVAIAADGSGNVYVAGKSKNANNDYDVFVIKYNTSGDTLWTRNWDGGAAGDDEARAMAVDASGNVYLTGSTDADASLLVSNDYISLKYSSAGALQWAVPYNGNGGGDDRAYAIALDNAGNAYVTGRTWNGTDYDIQTQKYASGNGAETAFATYASNLGDDQPAKIAIDNNGNVLLAGTSDRNATASTNRDYLTIQYNSSGAQQWLQLYNGAGTGDDDLADMVLDATGNVYVTGSSDLDSTAADNLDYVTIKYNSAGSLQWSRSYNGAAGETDAAFALALGVNNSVNVTGQANEGTPQVKNNNAVTLIYDNQGNQQQKLVYDGPINATDAGSVILAANGGIYVAGYTTNTLVGQKDMVNVFYIIPEGITDVVKNTLVVYPNPCAGNSQVIVPGEGTSQISVFNQMGEVVYQQAAVNNAVINILHWPAGIYVVERLTNNQRAVAKLAVQQ